MNGDLLRFSMMTCSSSRTLPPPDGGRTVELAVRIQPRWRLHLLQFRHPQSFPSWGNMLPFKQARLERWCRSPMSLFLNQLASNVDRPDQKISGWVTLLCIYSCRSQMCNVETVCHKITKHYWLGSRFQNIRIQLSFNYYVYYYLFFGAGSSRADFK